MKKQLVYAVLLGLSLIGSGPGHAVPYANPNAPKGGTLVLGYPSYPKDILYYLATEETSAGIASMVFETLTDRDPETYEIIPLLAKEWKISEDKKTFTFKLDPTAKFSDGTPLTAEDVKFTWDTILNPKNKTVPFQSLYADFEPIVVVDPHTVQFKAKSLHFKNFEKVAELAILPKHFFSKGDFNKAFKQKLLGSGPYTIEAVKPGDRITFKRDPNYWGAKLTQNVGANNFERVIFRAVPDYTVQYELFKKGEIDVYYFLVAKMWATETDGPQYQQGYIKKLKADVLRPFGSQGFVWNLRKPLFSDKRVRLALSHLMNREQWIKDLFYGNYVMATGVIAQNSEYHSPKVKAVNYDPKKAKELLKEAGWSKLGSDGVLEKDGQRFEFTYISSNKAEERYLTRFQEDVKKLGIKMNIRNVDWATEIRLADDREFDALGQARSREPDPSDFALLWGSKEADRKGSPNTSGYKNAELDKLADEIDKTFDKKKRIPMVQRIDEILAEDQVMSFAWEATYLRMGYANRFGMPPQHYVKWADWKSIWRFWWHDEAKTNKLAAARKANQPMKD